MKHGKLWLALAALSLMCGVVLADNNVLDHGTYFQNATNGAKTDVSGNASVTESNPAMDAGLTFTNVINNTALAVAAADSNVVPLDTRRMRLGMLLIKASPASGTGSINRFAISIRTQLLNNTDSLSTFCIYQYGKSGLGVTVEASQLDTTMAGHIFTGSTSVPWSGEFVITYDRARVGPNGTAALFPYPNGIAIPLQSLFGRDLYSPYTTIRIRNLVGPTCAVTVHLLGTPL